MAKNRFDGSGVTDLHDQLTKAVAGIRPDLLVSGSGISTVTALAAGIRSAVGPTVDAIGAQSSLMKAGMVSERILGVGVAASIARGVTHAERMFDSPTFRVMREIERATRRLDVLLLAGFELLQ